MALIEMGGSLTGTVTEDTLFLADGAATISGAVSQGNFLDGRFDGLYGYLDIDNEGRWTYTLNNALGAVQSLALNASVHDYFMLTWFAGGGEDAFAQAIVDIEARGVNDPATFGGDLAASVDASTATGASGQAIVNDVDTGEKEFQPATLTETFGSLMIDKNGNWQYELLPGVQTQILDEDKEGTDTFSVMALDGTATSIEIQVFDGGANYQPGTTGNDTFTAGAGHQAFDGLAGIDTVIFDGNRANYNLDFTASGQTVRDNVGAGSTDTLANIERLQFADAKIALDLLPTGHAGQALEFIGTIAFSVIDSPTVVGAIISFFDDGHTLTTLSQLAIDVGLIRDLAGSDSNADLARLVFRNIIEQEADSQTVDALVSYMDGRNASLSQAEFIAILAEWEGNQQHIDLVGLQQTGVEFTV